MEKVKRLHAKSSELPPGMKKAISLEPNVGMTSNQTVNLSSFCCPKVYVSNGQIQTIEEGNPGADL